MDTSSPPAARRCKPGSRQAHNSSERDKIVSSTILQRIVSAGRVEGQIESHEHAKVPKTGSDVFSSGHPTKGITHPKLNAHIPGLVDTKNRNPANLDASNGKNDGDSVLLKSTKILLPEHKQEKLDLESLATSKSIQKSKINETAENTFELSEHVLNFDAYDLNGKALLKVDKSIVFSPYKLPHCFSFTADSAVNCFKAVIRIHNTGKFNMAYLVESSSLKTFEIRESIGYICPESTKDIMIITYPKYHLKYKDVAASSFCVSGYPIYFRSQLAREKLNALWSALSCQVLSAANLERHAIDVVYPQLDSMLDEHSILERIQIRTLLYGNRTKIDRLKLPAIGEMEFYALWIGDKTNDDLLLKFKFCQFEKYFQQQFETEKGLLRKILVIGGLLISTLFVGAYKVYLDFYGFKEVKVELSWYEEIYNTCVNNAGYIFETFTNGISYPFKSFYAMIFT